MRLIKRIDVSHASGQLTLHGDLLIVGQQPTPWAPPETGGSMEYPFRGSQVADRPLAALFDISDPGRPEHLSEWIAPGFATHRNGYPGGQFAFMSAWIPGYRGQSVLVILDVSNPRHPNEAGRWWMPGQAENEDEILPPSGSRPACLHPTPHVDPGLYAGARQPGHQRPGLAETDRAPRLLAPGARRHAGHPYRRANRKRSLPHFHGTQRSRL
jgi:hypothetical protein